MFYPVVLLQLVYKMISENPFSVLTFIVLHTNPVLNKNSYFTAKFFSIDGLCNLLS